MVLETDIHFLSRFNTIKASFFIQWVASLIRKLVDSGLNYSRHGHNLGIATGRLSNPGAMVPVLCPVNHGMLKPLDVRMSLHSWWIARILQPRCMAMDDTGPAISEKLRVFYGAFQTWCEVSGEPLRRSLSKSGAVRNDSCDWRMQRISHDLWGFPARHGGSPLSLDGFCDGKSHRSIAGWWLV